MPLLAAPPGISPDCPRRLRMARIGSAVGVALLLLVAGGCGGDGATAPGSGSLQLVSRTTGSDTDVDGYLVRIDGGTAVTVAPNTAVTLHDVAAGTHQISVGGVASNCTLGGAPDRSVRVVQGAVVEVTIEATCTERTIASFVVTPDSLSMTYGGVVTHLTATARDADGNVLERSVAWESSEPGTASVVAGAVTSHHGGVVTITARTGAFVATAKVVVVGIHFVDVAASDVGTTCAVSDAGGTYCWGDNTFGLLGVGQPSSATAKAVAVPAPLVRISAGRLHVCGLTADGDAYCWGNNSAAQLGNGSSGDLVAPPSLVVGAHHFTSISAGGDNTCALDAAGAAYCWGMGINSALGNGADTGSAVPVPVVGGHEFRTLSMGRDFACGVTDAGDAYCWGGTALGTTAVQRSNVPVLVEGGHRWSSVSAGYRYACGLTDTGAVLCWGEGPLGNADGTSVSATPLPVAGGLTFASLSAGQWFACGITTAGAGYCWGDNYAGALGNGGDPNGLTPGPVAGGLALAKIAAGADHACAISDVGRTYCWGSNVYGQLGIGAATAPQNTPQQVAASQ